MDLQNLPIISEVEEDGEVEEVEVEAVLINPALNRSSSARKQEQTVGRHFQKYFSSFVKKENPAAAVFNDYISIVENNVALLNQDIVGKSFSYLHKVVKLSSLRTVESYLSSFKGIIERHLPEDHVLRKDRNFFPKLRKEMRNIYKEEGNAPPGSKLMTIDEFNIFTKLLFERGNLMDRLLLCFQWQTLGRISEAVQLKIADLMLLINGEIRALTIHISRSKVRVKNNTC